MSKFCTHCGAELIEGTEFCSKCGKSINNKSSLTPSTKIQPKVSPSQSPYQQQYMQPPKSNKKLVISLIAIIAIVLVVIVLIFIFMGNSADDRFVGTSADDRFVGTWEYSEGGFTVTYKFNSDGTFLGDAMGTNIEGEWEVNGDELCLSILGNKQCGPYSFSSDGNQLTLISTDDGSSSITLTKK